MPGFFPDVAATSPARVTGGTAGPAADRGQAAPLPAAQVTAPNLPLAWELGLVASRKESQEVWRMFS